MLVGGAPLPFSRPLRLTAPAGFTALTATGIIFIINLGWDIDPLR